MVIRRMLTGDPGDLTQQAVGPSARTVTAVDEDGCSFLGACWSLWVRRWPLITRRLGALLLSLVTQ